MICTQTGCRFWDRISSKALTCLYFKYLTFISLPEFYFYFFYVWQLVKCKTLYLLWSIISYTQHARAQVCLLSTSSLQLHRSQMFPNTSFLKAQFTERSQNLNLAVEISKVAAAHHPVCSNWIISDRKLSQYTHKMKPCLQHAAFCKVVKMSCKLTSGCERCPRTRGQHHVVH